MKPLRNVHVAQWLVHSPHNEKVVVWIPAWTFKRWVLYVLPCMHKFSPGIPTLGLYHSPKTCFINWWCEGVALHQTGQGVPNLCLTVAGPGSANPVTPKSDSARSENGGMTVTIKLRQCMFLNLVIFFPGKKNVNVCIWFLPAKS